MVVDYSVVIPVYRGSSTIEELYNKIQSFFNDKNKSFEVIYVFDCGPDNSWQVIKQLKSKWPQTIKGVHLSRNFGQHNAIICGFKYCIGKYIITMDEDLQHDPTDIALLIEKQEEKDYDVVYGNYTERKHNFFRNTTSFIMKKLLELGIPDLHKDYSAFRLLKADIARTTITMNSSYTFLDGYLTWVTKNVSATNVKHLESQAGKSSYTFKKLLNHSVNIFITFSTIPTRIITYSSVLVFLLSTVYTIYILFRKIFFNDFVPGFATYMIIGGFGLGMIIFCLGIIAEYLQRINMKTTHRPPFLEKTIIE